MRYKIIGYVAVNLLLFMFIGCQTTPTKPQITQAIDEEKSQTIRLFLGCIRYWTEQMDDKVSDASVIATTIIKGPCYREAENVVEIFSRGGSPRAKEMFRDRFFAEGAIDDALFIILQERKKTAK